MNEEIEITELEINVPKWIDQDITNHNVEAIIQGGCASGAYMPAVTYHTALKTMNEHGDEILDYIESMGDIEYPSEQMSWSGLACHFVSVAVELWAFSVESQIEEKGEK